MAFPKAVRLAAALGVCVMMLGHAWAAEPAAPPAEPKPASKPAGQGTVIVVVDANRVQRESLAGRAMLAERERYQQSFNTKFETARKDLQTEEQELARKRSAMPADEFQSKVRALNAKVADFQRRYQNAVRALDKASGQAGNELQKAVISITGEVAAEQGADLVLHKQHVFLHDERMDITASIIERLNLRLPSVRFPVPQTEDNDGATQSTGKK